MTNEDIKLFEKRIARIESWLVTTAEAMEVMLDRVQNPGDFAPDLQRAFDLAAVQDLREAAGFTKYGLSRESGVSREYIGKIERG
jgi:hypothetical protein